MTKRNTYYLYKDSDAALVLRFAKVNKGTITLAHLQEMNHRKFNNVPNVRRMLSALVKYGLMSTPNGGSWALTPYGLSSVYKLATDNLRLQVADHV